MIHQSAEVHYTTEILNPDGTVAERRARKRNLILDGGLDMVANTVWASCFTHCAVGTGTRPTKRDSGSVTFSRSGSEVTSSASFFEAQDVGRRLKFDTGEEMRITAYTSTTAVTVDASGTLPAAEGTVWYTNEAGHEDEKQRTAAVQTGPGKTGTLLSGPTVTMQRTWLFPPESGPVTYREIGWAPGASGALFGRDLIPGVGDSLIAGQQYKVAVELSVTVGPYAARPSTSAEVQGLPVTFEEKLCNWGVAWVNEDNSIDTTLASTEPSSLVRFGLEQRSAFSNWNTAPTCFHHISGVNESYTPGSFRRRKSASWGPTQANDTWRQILLATPTSAFGLEIMSSAPWVKANTHILRVAVDIAWGRTLVN